MSAHRLSEIPSNIRYLLKLFEEGSKCMASNRTLESQTVHRKLFDQYSNFQRYKMIYGKTAKDRYKLHDFSPFHRRQLDIIFQESASILPEIHISTEQAFKSDIDIPEIYQSEPISSNSNRRSKFHSSFMSKLWSSVASFYNPLYLHIDHLSNNKSLRWYEKLLRDTPVIIFLKQRNRLFSESTLYETNKPLIDIQDAFMELTQDLKTNNPSTGENRRSYHFTNLTELGAFNSALNHQVPLRNNYEDTNKLPDENSREALSIASDKLIEYLSSVRNIQMVDSDFKPVQFTEEQLQHDMPFADTVANFENSNWKDKLTCDLIYDDLYILTIENDQLTKDHSELLHILDKFGSEFEIVAARLNTRISVIDSYLHKIPKRESISDALSYEDLLMYAKSARSEKSEKSEKSGNSVHHLENLLKKIGVRGLTRVEYDGFNCAVYCYKDL